MRQKLEDAFMLANPMMFLTTARDKPGLELEVWTEAQEQKVGVRFGPALMADDWTIPRYIPEGLVWFAVNDSPPPLLPFGRFSRSCNGSPVRVSLEATGVYSLDLAFALDAEEGIEVAVLNPRSLIDLLKPFNGQKSM
jgi:hypothetical protein